jgi:hypothetical protein
MPDVRKSFKNFAPFAKLSSVFVIGLLAMSVINVTLQLPEELAERATAAGLLSSEQISAWLEAELDRKDHLKLLRADLERLRAVSEPLSDDEVTALVDEEISAYRAEKHQKTSQKD